VVDANIVVALTRVPRESNDGDEKDWAVSALCSGALM